MAQIEVKPLLDAHYTRTLTLFLVLAFSFSCFAQSDSIPPAKGKKITIKQADKIVGSKQAGKNRLLGNVIFEHEGALMYCDSAWSFSADNRLEAFQNVQINQGDTLFLWGDYLEYSGNTKRAKVTGDEVRLKDQQMTLTTTRLDYDRNTNISYYTTGGEIVNEENNLTSKKGFYNSATKFFHFKDSVLLTNPDYIMECDTLDYNSNSRIAYFKGPSTITSDSSFIYCENGQYNTQIDIAQFEKNALIYDDNKYLTGDSIYYEKHKEYGEAFGNVLIHDTIENYMITGNYGEYSGTTDSAFVTKEPTYSVIESIQDTLHVHGDTIYSLMVLDSLSKQRSRLVKVFNSVKIYKPNMQGKCDSLSYSARDSIFRMYEKPVIWDDSTQITGDTIYITTKKNKPDSMFVFQNAFMLSQIDNTKDNQVSGKLMIGKFLKDELRRVYVNGNGQTVYYPKEDDGDYIGMNRSICSNILIYLRDSELQRIVFMIKPEGKMHPMNKIPGDQKQLPGYSPRFNERPKSKADIYINDQ